MKTRYLNSERIFIPAIIFSIMIHGFFIVGTGMMPSLPQASILNAPNSLEINVIPQPVVTIVEQEIMTEEVINLGEAEKVVYRNPDPVKKQKKKIQPVLNSQKSQGAVTDAKPLMKSNLAPVYPQLARKRGWEGIVRLNVFVKKDGTTNQVDIQKSSGHSVLDQAAQNAVEKWKFMPAKSGALQYSSKISLPIQFTLVKE